MLQAHSHGVDDGVAPGQGDSDPRGKSGFEALVHPHHDEGVHGDCLESISCYREGGKEMWSYESVERHGGFAQYDHDGCMCCQLTSQLRCPSH
jgi:hypothetical protein